MHVKGTDVHVHVWLKQSFLGQRKAPAHDDDDELLMNDLY
jgi:hypothetical protein